MIDLKPEYLNEMKRILLKHVPHCEVCLFGSRANGKARPNSDIDLVLKGKEKLEWQKIEQIKQELAESNLPYLVDVLDWNALPGNVQTFISAQYETIQKAQN